MNPGTRSAFFDKPIDNSHVIRERDPRAHRRFGAVLAVVSLLVCGLVLYAWPHFASLQAGMAAERLQREKERLREDNRKLRLERATLEDLGRVENIAVRRLGLDKPKPGQVVVVETLPRTPGDAQRSRTLASQDERDSSGKERQ